MFKPNPMFLFNSVEARRILHHFGVFHLENKNEIKIGFFDARTQDGLAAMQEAVAGFAEQYPRKIVLEVSVDTKLKKPHYVYPDGSIVEIDEKNANGAIRTYFDGTTIKEGNLGHANVVCIDLDNEIIFLQDPKGCLVDEAIKNVLRKIFPDFELQDLQLKQQRDQHSCFVISICNMVSFSYGNILLEHVDVEQIRREFCCILDAYDRKFGLTHSASASERFVLNDVVRQRYQYPRLGDF